MNYNSNEAKNHVRLILENLSEEDLLIEFMEKMYERLCELEDFYNSFQDDGR